MSVAAENSSVNGLDWQMGIAHHLVKAGVSTAAFVPDSRLSGLLPRLDELGVTLRALTREEECVAYAAGQRIAGRMPVVLMQSSGLGNSLNALGSLVVPYRLGMPIIISMRGSLGERNPSQIPLGQAARKFLDALGIPAFSLRTGDAVPSVVDGVLSLASDAGQTAAILLEPELGGGE